MVGLARSAALAGAYDLEISEDQVSEVVAVLQRMADRAGAAQMLLVQPKSGGDAALVPQVAALLDDPAGIVRAMAVWALSRLLGEPAFVALRNQRINSETDASVRREWETA